MKNYAIICDSCVSLTSELAKELGVTIAPLTIIHNNKEYLDQIDITHDGVNDLLRNKEQLQTSQPNLGMLINLLNDVSSTGPDHIFILTLTSALSGTYNAFYQAVEEVNLPNVTLIDSRSIAGIVQHCVKKIRQMEANDAEVAEVEAAIHTILGQTESFVYPQTLDQLKISGRISKGAATLASLLKVKPLLRLENDGDTIEKFGTARTEAKVFEMIVSSLKENNVNPATHDIYYLENSAAEIVERADDYITENLGKFNTSVSKLPAVVATHAGLGTIAIQWVVKI